MYLQNISTNGVELEKKCIRNVIDNILKEEDFKITLKNIKRNSNS
jgi:hypothetical protein